MSIKIFVSMKVTLESTDLLAVLQGSLSPLQVLPPPGTFPPPGTYPPPGTFPRPGTNINKGNF